MPKNNNIKIGKYKVLTADWFSVIEVDENVFEDAYVEACTRAIEIKVRNLGPHDDLMVNPIMVCKKLNIKRSKEKFINTYKVLLNAGYPTRAELLREIFMENVKIDLASEPLSASLKS